MIHAHMMIFSRNLDREMKPKEAAISRIEFCRSTYRVVLIALIDTEPLDLVSIC